MNSWFAEIDIYCERTTALFWAEPVNALTNFVFVGVGLWALRSLKNNTSIPEVARFWTTLLSWNVVVIGIGSFLFHTLGNTWSQLADVFPITVFMVLFLAYSLRHLLHFSYLGVGGGVIAFLVVGAVVETIVPKTFLNGSSGYLPALLALLVTGHLIRDRLQATARLFILAIAIFICSLAFRSVDLVVCESWPLGTHFMWHLLNGALLGTLIQVPQTANTES